VVHPATYVNKVVLGFDNGIVELWNIRTKKLIYTFNPSEALGIDRSIAGVVCIEQSPACDVVGVGFESGHVLLFNLKLDKVLFSFSQQGRVTSISFRTDSHAFSGTSAYLASASGNGQIFVWRLGGAEGDDAELGGFASRRGLVCTIDDAHGKINALASMQLQFIFVSHSW
jgi:U3 small nucleolar RNA-associated protein 21